MNYYQLIFRADFRDSDFYEGRTYIFKSELDLEKGNYVVAVTKYGYQIAVVYEKNDVEVPYSCYEEGVARIVTKLDGDYYKEKAQAEELKEIEKTLNQKTREMSKIIQYETIAKYDPNAKELLERYKQLKNNNTQVIEIEAKNESDEDELPF